MTITFISILYIADFAFLLVIGFCLAYLYWLRKLGKVNDKTGSLIGDERVSHEFILGRLSVLEELI